MTRSGPACGHSYQPDGFHPTHESRVGRRTDVRPLRCQHPELRERCQLKRKGTLQECVVVQNQDPEADQSSELGRNRTRQIVVVQVHLGQSGQAAKLDGNGIREVIEAQVQVFQAGQIAECARFLGLMGV